MYVISRVLSFEKGNRDKIVEKYSQPPVMIHFPGFIRRDVLLDQKDPEKDVLRILIYWESKEAFYKFEGSPMHIAMHKDKSNPSHQKKEGLIDTHRETYEVIASDIYVKE
jgi:heme oxygenase (staphylobilin-producing)